MLAHVFGKLPSACTWHEPRTVWVYADPGRVHDRFEACDAVEPVRSYIRRRFERYASARGATFLAEKTPSNVVRVPYVNRIFPEARFVHIVRHPVAVAESAESVWSWTPGFRRVVRRIRETPVRQLPFYLRKAVSELAVKVGLESPRDRVWGLRYPGWEMDFRERSLEEFSALQWLHGTRAARQDLDGVDPARVATVRYEDMVADPREAIAAILDHFGIHAADSVNRMAKAVHGDRKNAWTSVPIKDQRRVFDIVGSEASRWGYGLNGVDRPIQSVIWHAS